MGLRIGGGIGPLRGSVGKGGARIGVGGSVGPVSASKSVRVGGAKKGATPGKVASKPAPPPSKGELAFGAASLLIDRHEKRKKKREKERARHEAAAAKQRRDEEKWARTVARTSEGIAKAREADGPLDGDTERIPGAEFASLASASGLNHAARESSRVLADVLMRCVLAVAIYGTAFAILVAILCVIFPPVRLLLFSLFID